MLRKLLPLILALIGLGGGVGAGVMLRPDHQEVVAITPCGPAPEGGDAGQAAEGDKAAAEGHGEAAPADGGEEGAPVSEFVKLNNQFIVPVVADGHVDSLVILSLSLEVKTGDGPKVYMAEPKLRDRFLQVLFDHANSGGFDGNFTASGHMEVLRNGLLEAARQELGATVGSILIESIVRQDAA